MPIYFDGTALTGQPWALYNYRSKHYNISFDEDQQGMRTIDQVFPATHFSSNTTMQMLRIIGSVDMHGKGTEHPLAAVDPFIFLDEVCIDGEMPTSFRQHPHTGLVAITYLLEGTVHAWDNLHGITPDFNRVGGVYWVQACAGIVHREVPTEGIR